MRCEAAGGRISPGVVAGDNAAGGGFFGGGDSGIEGVCGDCIDAREELLLRGEENRLETAFRKPILRKEEELEGPGHHSTLAIECGRVKVLL